MESTGRESQEMVYEGRTGVEEVRKRKVEQNKGRERMKIAYTNIDGIISSKLELEDYLRKENPVMACIVETKLGGEVQVPAMDGGRYKVWRRDREGKRGGGVMVLLREDIKAEKVEVGKGRAELLKVRISTGERRTRSVAVAYVPPKSNAWKDEEYKDMLKDTKEELERLMRENRDLILMGDFNCKEVEWESLETTGSPESWGAVLLELAMDNLMTQWVTEKTRYRGEDEPSRLDLVFTKEVDVIGDILYRSPLGRSDHVLIEMVIIDGDVCKGRDGHRRNRLNYGRTNFSKLRKFFEKVDWSDLLGAGNVQDQYDIFGKIYKEGVTKYVPTYKERRLGKKEWFNGRCEAARAKKEKAWNKMRRRNTQKNREEFKRARNEYVQVRRQEERNYEKDIVDNCKNEPKMFYRFINGKMKQKVGVSRVKDEGSVYEEDEDICEVMNKKFQEVFTKESEFEGNVERGEEIVLKDIVVEKKDLLDRMSRLDGRKAVGPDGIAGMILKECKDQLLLPVYNIIVSSLTEGKVPSEWKRAHIVPIYKGGNNEDPLNYRPVSLTSVMCKLCEGVIKDEWLKYLERMKVITEAQFGFRRGKSCVTNLLCFYSRVIEVVQEREGWADCVYLDLRKAFDKVPHKRLIWKIEKYGGVQGKLLEWMKDYLTERQMSTVVRGAESSWGEVTSGVPQGSVLGPLMFVIYVNDMVEGIDSYVSLFADDAKIMRRIENIESCEQLQQDLDRIYEWSRDWEMEFNARKCHVMEMGKSKGRPSGNYKLGEGILQKVTEEKDLGVVMEDSLSPEKHVNRITGATYRLVTNMKMAFHYMDEEMLIKLIKSIIRPQLEYAAVVWTPHKKKHIRKLERIQRAATKMVPSLSGLSYEERLRSLGLPTLEDRRKRGDLITVYKHMRGIERLDREDWFVWNDDEHRGHGRKLKKTRCRKDIKKFSFPYRCVDEWNKLDMVVIEARNVHEFKGKLDKCRYGDRSVRA